MLKRIAAGAALATTISVTALAPAAHAAPNVLQPSTSIGVDRVRGDISGCTLGFIFGGADGRPRALTSRHCTDLRQQVFTRDMATVGVVVAHGIDDVALIDITSDLPVSDEVPGLGHLSGAITPDELNRTRPLICKAGAKTGLSCGPMVRSATDSSITFSAPGGTGDSGSPTYVVKPNGDILAAGTLRGGFASEPGVADAVPIAPYMAQWDLRLS